MKNDAQKVAIVTGDTGGIGLETALALKARGWLVYGVSRRALGVEGVEHISADVSDEAAAKGAVEYVMAKRGRLDALINAAGFGISGALEFTSAEDARAQMNVNVIGTANMCRAACTHMRVNRGGRIVNVSSVAALLPIPFQGWYSASKAAINAYTMALANELAPFNVSACAVMPGDIATGFTAARRKNNEGDDIYSRRISKAIGKMENDESNGMPAHAVGEFIAKIASKKRVKPLYTIGFSYKLIVAIQKILPCRFVNAVIGGLYGGK